MYKIIGADGKEYGPVSAEEIKQWIREGRAVATTRAQAVGAADWRNLCDFPEFAGCFADAATPPSAPAPLPPPGAAPTTAPAMVDPEQEAAAIIARGLHFSIGDCLSAGWRLVTSDFWPVVGVSALIMVIMTATNMAWVGLLLIGPLLGGLFHYFLKKVRGQPAVLGDAFAGFTMAFLQLFLLYLISSLFITLGLLLCLIPGIYLMVAYYFVYPLMIDRRLDFWPAMEISRRVVNKIWWQVLGLALVLALVNLLGVLALCVGVFISFPVTVAAITYAYEAIFNGRQPPAA
ncbi:MAG: DUF4339 domain-containing protein [Verrucomicrobiae bacterium]|nr:DUF4339 domain-containing protein [Verrucomicrobiae bacterium]